MESLPLPGDVVRHIARILHEGAATQLQAAIRSWLVRRRLFALCEGRADGIYADEVTDFLGGKLILLC